jgi:hypothetical protein
MGARCTFVFKQSKNQAVALYSHWGEDTMYEDLAAALQHAAPRKSDESYYTRMAISYLLKDDLLDELHYGLYACDPSDQAFMDHPITIDLTDGTVGEGEEWHTIDEFINYHMGTTNKLVTTVTS